MKQRERERERERERKIYRCDDSLAKCRFLHLKLLQTTSIWHHANNSHFPDSIKNKLNKPPTGPSPARRHPTTINCGGLDPVLVYAVHFLADLALLWPACGSELSDQVQPIIPRGCRPSEHVQCGPDMGGNSYPYLGLHCRDAWIWRTCLFLWSFSAVTVRCKMYLTRCSILSDVAVLPCLHLDIDEVYTPWNIIMEEENIMKMTRKLDQIRYRSSVTAIFYCVS